MIVARSSELVFTGDHRQRIVSKHNATRPHWSIRIGVVAAQRPTTTFPGTQTNSQSAFTQQCSQGLRPLGAPTGLSYVDSLLAVSLPRWCKWHP
jgi:hypothetical protein